MAKSLYTNNLDVLALLCLSKQNSLTSTEIRNLIQEKSHDIINISESVLRIVLFRLKESGYITVNNMPISGRSHKRIYNISESGRDRLSNMNEELHTLFYVVNKMSQD